MCPLDAVNSTAREGVQYCRSTYLCGLDDTLIAVGVCLDGEGVPVLALHDAVLGHPVLRLVWVLDRQKAQGVAHTDVFRYRKCV